MSENKRKICIVVTLPTWGGAQRYVYDISSELHKQGEDVIVVAGQGPTMLLLDKLRGRGVITHQFQHLVREVSLVNDILCFFEMRRYFKSKHFDVIHLNSSKAGVIGAIAAKMAGVKKVIYTAHGFVFNESLSRLKKYLYIFLEWVSFIFTDTIITVSRFDKESAMKLRIADPRKIHVVHNGVATNKTLLLDRDESRNFFESKIGKKIPSTPVIGAISNLYVNKGLVYLIEAAKIVHQAKKNVVFIVVGEGPIRGTLEALIREKGIGDAFYLVGFLEDPEKFLPGFDIYVSSSIKEGLPYSLLSAMASGRAIVSTDAGGCREIIAHETTGLIVPPADSHALAKKILELINDQDLRTQLASNAQKEASRFSLDRMVDLTKSIYENE